MWYIHLCWPQLRLVSGNRTSFRLLVSWLWTFLFNLTSRSMSIWPCKYLNAIVSLWIKQIFSNDFQPNLSKASVAEEHIGLAVLSLCGVAVLSLWQVKLSSIRQSMSSIVVMIQTMVCLKYNCPRNMNEIACCSWRWCCARQFLQCGFCHRLVSCNMAFTVHRISIL